MDAKKRKRLEQARCAVGSAAEFLARLPGERALVEPRLALSRTLLERRTEAGLPPQQLAQRTGSSQSRVATMEAGDRRISLDLLIRALLRIGASRRDVDQSLLRRVT